MAGLLFANDDDFHVYQLQVCTSRPFPPPEAIHPSVCPLSAGLTFLPFFCQCRCDSALVRINFRIARPH